MDEISIIKRRELFRINIRKQQIEEILQHKRYVSRSPPLEKEDLDQLIKDLGAHNIKQLQRNRTQIHKNHLQELKLLKKISQLGPSSNKRSIKILQQIILSKELSCFIFQEKEQLENLQLIIFNISNSHESENEKSQFWKLLKTIYCNPFSQKMHLKILKMLVSSVVSTSTIYLTQLKILELLLPKYKNQSMLSKIIIQDCPNFFSVINNILRDEQRLEIKHNLLIVIKIFIKISMIEDQTHIIISKEFINLIWDLKNNSQDIKFEVISILKKILNTKFHQLIQIENIFDEIGDIILYSQNLELVKSSFKLLKRYQNQQNTIQPNERFCNLLNQILQNDDNNQIIILALEFLIEQQQYIIKFVNHLDFLIRSKNQQITQLCAQIQDLVE